MQTRVKRAITPLLTATAVLLAVTSAGFGAINVLDFDGESRVYIEESTVFQQNFDAMTLDFWFKLNEPVENWSIMVHRHDANGTNVGDTFWYAGFQSAGYLTVTFNARNSNFADGQTADKPAAGVWHHVAGVWDGERGHVYLNGVLIHSYDTVPMTGNGVGGMAFGGPVGGDLDFRSFEGQLSEVRLWDRALIAADVDFLRHYRLTGQESGLIGYWPLDEGGGTVAHDGTPAGNDGDIVNAVWTTTESLDLDPNLGFSLIAPFSLANTETGSTRFTGDNTVALLDPPMPATATHFQITEEPGVESLTGVWVGTNAFPATATFSLPAEEGPVELYAWFTNTTESAQDPLWRSVGSITYTTAEPTALTVDNWPLATGHSVSPIEVNAHSTGGAFDGIPLAIHAMTLSVQNGPDVDATPEAPEVTLNTPGVYTLALQVVNEAGNQATAPVSVSVHDPGTVGITGGDWVFDTRIEGVLYRVHVFTNTLPTSISVSTAGSPHGLIDYLVVAGGGGGGGRGGGGGGAGGVILRERETITNGVFSLIVGEGGAAGIGHGGLGDNGGESSFFGSIALGGGGGGGRGAGLPQLTPVGRDGGSGGGAGGQGHGEGGRGLQPEALGKSEGFGNDGIRWDSNTAGGGGGAGGPGSTIHGGPGMDVSAWFTSAIGENGYVGGGGGGGTRDSRYGSGGIGGGGRGAPDSGDLAHAGLPGTGGGGGGGGDTTRIGKAGGSGIVVIRYEFYPGTIIRVR